MQEMKHRPISLRNIDAKTMNKVFTNWTQPCIKIIINTTMWGLFHVCRLVQHSKFNWCIHQIHKFKKENHIYSNSHRKYIGQNPTPIHDFKNSKQIRIQGQLLNLIKKRYKKLRAIIILNGEKLHVFHLRLTTRQECLLSPLLFNIIPEVQTSEKIKKRK